MTPDEKRQRVDELLSGIRITREDVRTIKKLVSSLQESEIGIESHAWGPSGALAERDRLKALKKGRALLKRLKGKS